jgi:hypothetical protein
MTTSQTIARDHFTKRLATLCLRSGLAGFPKDDADQQILLKSAIMMIGDAEALTEQEINRKLDAWITQVCPIQGLDRVTLRRRLVDAGYLLRSSDGARYQSARSGPRPGYFDAEVDEVDVVETIQTAREEMERRKREFLAKGKGA